jgi:phosphoribosylaminoimidazolecarboxamide formyltransferase / IMP cyclohydrolase
VRALISVYDRTGLDEFARGLVELGVEIVSTGGGTHAYLVDLGLEPTVVDVPQLLDGRVKTLDPRIHAAILARRDRDEDAASLRELGVQPLDLVCVNLYPFDDVAWRRGVTEAEAIEMIDVGGPAMLRAAAKNFAHVAPVSSPGQYEDVLRELAESGALSFETRRRLAREAFAMTAAYESSIARWFGEAERFPHRITLALEKITELEYGENPHQSAAFYAHVDARRHVLSRVEQVSGPRLTFNNLHDLSAARGLLDELTLPACVIVKHANPCGAAVASSIEDAYEHALASDPVSAYGGVVALNRSVMPELGSLVAERFFDLVFAPGYEPEALEALSRRPAARILLDSERRRSSAGERDYRRVLGGLLVQDRDEIVEERETMDVICGDPDEQVWGDLLFAWRVCKHVTSNAIVLVKNLQTIGIGAGQMSRVDAVRIAVDKGRELGHDMRGAALASDAFFPFADGPLLALQAGVTAIIQPGGSKRDPEVIRAVQDAGAAMVFTGRRHFRH